MAAARRGECDLAGVHLLDPATGLYNRHLLATGDLQLVTGYRRLQGLVFRADDARFVAGATAADVPGRSPGRPGLPDDQPQCRQRHAHPDRRLLGGQQPPGYWAQAKSHNAVAVAVAQGRADWGVAIEPAAHAYGLGFLPLQPEHYDFLAPTSRLMRASVQRFIALLADPAVRDDLAALGFSV